MPITCCRLVAFALLFKQRNVALPAIFSILALSSGVEFELGFCGRFQGTSLVKSATVHTVARSAVQLSARCFSSLARMVRLNGEVFNRGTAILSATEHCWADYASRASISIRYSPTDTGSLAERRVAKR
jgi:hypothetical protein